MRPPSVQLLRALRATELKSSPAHAVQQATCSLRRFLVGTTSYSSKIIPNALCATRPFASSAIHRSSKTPKSSDRGPPSKEDTQTDFGSMNVLGNTPAPTTAIDACLSDGFHFDNGLKISGGSGCLLVAGEAFDWRPWEAGSRAEGLGKGRMISKKGQWDAETEAWGILDLVWPKPGTVVLLPFTNHNGVALSSGRGQGQSDS